MRGHYSKAVFVCKGDKAAGALMFHVEHLGAFRQQFDFYGFFTFSLKTCVMPHDATPFRWGLNN